MYIFVNQIHSVTGIGTTAIICAVAVPLHIVVNITNNNHAEEIVIAIGVMLAIQIALILIQILVN
jgi:hypothetical protein